MANSFKTFLPEDIANTRTLLHEAIPITGTIVSGTYADNNIKTYSHGMFESAYDYPYLSSSANHIFDITWGLASGSTTTGTDRTGWPWTQGAKKVNIYNQMALILNNTDVYGNIQSFDRDGSADADTSDDIREAIFLSFARLLNKDEIKKDSFRLGLFLSGNNQTGSCGGKPCLASLTTVGDYNAQTSYKTNSPAGEYGLLYTSSDKPLAAGGSSIGHIYYQTGVVVLTASLFTYQSAAPNQFGAGNFTSAGGESSTTGSVELMLTGATINQLADGLRQRIYNVQFNNTTELNSTIYFARAHNTEFNYSSNSTYLSASEIRVKGQNPAADPVSYITTVGLYSPDNELMAVAKVSEPLKKSPSNEITLRVRLDY